MSLHNSIQRAVSNGCKITFEDAVNCRLKLAERDGFVGLISIGENTYAHYYSYQVEHTDDEIARGIDSTLERIEKQILEAKNETR